MKRQVKYLGNKAIILPTAFIEFLDVFSRIVSYVAFGSIMLWLGWIGYSYLLLILQWR